MNLVGLSTISSLTPNMIWHSDMSEIYLGGSQGLGSALKGPLFTLWTNYILPWMDTINMVHGCARKIITSRYCYAVKILLGESSFLFESFKHYSNGHSTHLLRGLALYLFTTCHFPLYEEKSSLLGNSRSLPRRKRGFISPFLSLRCLTYQYIDPLVSIYWSFLLLWF